jgi:hypothetical protein
MGFVRPVQGTLGTYQLVALQAKINYLLVLVNFTKIYFYSFRPLR